MKIPRLQNSISQGRLLASLNPAMLGLIALEEAGVIAGQVGRDIEPFFHIIQILWQFISTLESAESTAPQLAARLLDLRTHHSKISRFTRFILTLQNEFVLSLIQWDADYLQKQFVNSERNTCL